MTPQGSDDEEPPRVDPVVTIATLLSGLVFWGGVGWLVDRWVGFDGVFLGVGLLLGFFAGIYLTWLRFPKA